MAKSVKVWYDPEGDYLEVLFSNEAGYMKETDNDAIIEKVNTKGEVIGFSILGVKEKTKLEPLYAELLN